MKRFFSLFQQQQNPTTNAPGNNLGSNFGGQTPVSPPTQNRNIDYVHPTLKQKLRSNERRYHMRVVIRGDRGSGKTQLFKRLKGEDFDSSHVTSTTLKSGYVHWNYKSIGDVTVLEMWDVPDSSKRKKNSGLKLQHNQVDSDDSESISSDEDTADMDADFELQMKQFLQNSNKIEEGSHLFSSSLNASIIDIYKNAQCVIIMINPLKRKSWKFAQRQFKKVPQELDVVFMINFKDLEKDFKVPISEIQQWVKSQEVELDKKIHTIETSMKDCFGLKNLFTYFNVPFCKLKIESVRKELNRLEEELRGNMEEIDLTLQESNYKRYVNWLKNGNAPETSVPFLREIRSANSPGSVSSSSALASPSPTEDPKKPSSTTKETKIPEHIQRKYDLLLSQSNISFKNEKLESVNDFKIEGSADNFWDDDSASDSDEGERVVNTVGLSPDELSSDEDNKVPSKSSKKVEKESKRGKDKKKRSSKHRSSKRSTSKSSRSRVEKYNSGDSSESEHEERRSKSRKDKTSSHKKNQRKKSPSKTVESPKEIKSNVKMQVEQIEDKPLIVDEKQNNQESLEEITTDCKEKENIALETQQIVKDEEDNEFVRKNLEKIEAEEKEAKIKEELLQDFALSTEGLDVSEDFFGGSESGEEEILETLDKDVDDSSNNDDYETEREIIKDEIHTESVSYVESEIKIESEAPGLSTDQLSISIDASESFFDSEEDKGYIEREEIEDEDSEDSEDNKLRRRKGRKSMKISKLSAPAKTTTAKTPTLSEEVLKAIQVAESQLKANVLEEEKKMEQRSKHSDKKHRREKRKRNDRKSKKESERRSRRSRKEKKQESSTEEDED